MPAVIRKVCHHYNQILQIRTGKYFESSVFFRVCQQQELNGVALLWQLRLSQLCAKRLQHLGNVLHHHSKALYGLHTHTHTHTQFRK